MSPKGFSVWAIVAFILGSALQVSGYQNRWVALALFFVCGLLLAGAVGFVLGARSARASAGFSGRRSELESHLVLEEALPTPVPATSPGAAKEDKPPEPKIYANMPLKEVGRITTLTSLARRQKLESLRGKWFTVEGIVRDIGHGYGTCFLSVDTADKLSVKLAFHESAWPQMSHADRGFYARAEGQLESVMFDTHMTLNNCILLFLSSSGPEQTVAPLTT